MAADQPDAAFNQRDRSGFDQGHGAMVPIQRTGYACNLARTSSINCARTGRRPFCSCPWWDQALLARFHRASLNKLTAHAAVIQPIAFLFATPSLWIALGEQLVQSVAGPLLRLNNQSSALDRQADLCPRPQVQNVEQGGRDGYHYRATDLAQPSCVSNVIHGNIFV